MVLDDGFQHLAAERTLDIVMLDARQPFANGWPLPAGELREFAPAYRRADVLVLSRCSEQDPLPPHFDGPVLRAAHRLNSTAFDLSGQCRPLDELGKLRGVAFAGIASPESFFASLRQAGLNLVEEIPLPDHVDYDRALIDRLNRLSAGADFLVTTEKDGVKLGAENLQLPCFQIPLRLEFLSGETSLIASLEKIIAQGRTMNLTDELLTILACPKCKGKVSLQEDRQGLICPACKLVYPVRDDIPVMLIDEATPI